MSKPTFFIDGNAPHELQQLITACDSIQAFDCLYGSADEDWLAQLQVTDAVSIAAIYLSHYTQTECDAFLESDLLAHTTFIFFSDGNPNPAIEHLIRNTGSFHFREPVNGQILNDTFADFAHELSNKREKRREVNKSQLDQFGLLLGSSQVMHALYRTLRKVAESEAHVFITGESGAGKELVANTIHIASERSDGPFIAVNCGALSPELVESELFGHIKGAFTGANKDKTGFFKQAQNGTLFLDEITEMPLEHQVKLLRVLESGEYRPVGADKLQFANVRVVAASNRVPAQAIEEGFIREDLYYRLAQFPISLPPLRERGEDIKGLALHFVAHRNAQEQTAKEIDEAALDKICSHAWPGNVRELRHVMERAFILSDHIIHAEHIVIDTLSTITNLDVQIQPGVPLAALEKVAIETTLEANDGNRSETAEQLGISVKTLYNKLEKYHQED